MLLEIRIQNFAVIEQLSLRLEPGLNALTGETGAGKSIIVGALSLLLGERASAETVRVGAAKAVVEGVFDVAAHPPIAELLQHQGIECEDGLLILRREVAAEGRSRAWVNGAASTVTLLASIGRLLVDLHGQHEHQTLLRAEEQRAMLDAYAGATELARDVRLGFGRQRAAEQGLAELDRKRREAEQRADYLRFQVNEIGGAGIRPGEDEDLETESKRLEHADELMRLSARLHADLAGDNRSVTNRIGELRRVLDQLVRIDPSQQDTIELLQTGYFALEELGQRMADYSSSIEHDPERLNIVRHRLDLLYRLKSKYGPTASDVAHTLETARAELDLIDGADFTRAELEAELQAARAELAGLARQLTKARKRAAERLGGEVRSILPDLGMASGNFQVTLEPVTAPGGQGAEDVRFLVALNAGFEPRDLSRVASGGELSRVMLALKTILARLDQVPTLVFDEIDAGIGGRVALQVAAKLCEVGRHHQVFSITHLPQIASRADHHLLVEKIEQEGTTLTRVTPLKGPERVRELARMLGGDPESATSLEHARELLAGD